MVPLTAPLGDLDETAHTDDRLILSQIENRVNRAGPLFPPLNQPNPEVESIRNSAGSQELGGCMKIIQGPVRVNCG